MPYDILHFGSCVKLFGVILATFSNSLILILLQRKASGKLGTYRYLMMSYTIIELVYSISYYLSDMAAHSTNTSYVLFRKYRGENRLIGSIILMQFCVMYIVVLTILAVHFIYRFFALCAKSKLPLLFTPRKLFIWILFCLIFGIIVGGFKCYMFYETPFRTRKLQAEFEKYYNLSMNEIVYNGPVYKLCDSETHCYNPKA
ncbi:unnamed protein product [Caenorhabditis angaria]|uniref:G-protein coupled receptors family 1 profile domain-containing protein n=1 Tax=Caenorhabditis angaria TaxID=860376 RepID=A0A9P1IX05_9PELO|nr:unnamed protein product [Caenorhabditis angaria]